MVFVGRRFMLYLNSLNMIPYGYFGAWFSRLYLNTTNIYSFWITTFIYAWYVWLADRKRYNIFHLKLYNNQSSTDSSLGIRHRVTYVPQIRGLFIVWFSMLPHRFASKPTQDISDPYFIWLRHIFVWFFTSVLLIVGNRQAVIVLWIK